MFNDYVRDRFGNIVAQYDGKYIRGRYGKILGEYNESDNTTRDRFGKIVGNGDQRARLIED